MTDVIFVDGMRVFKPNDRAPSFVKAAIEINLDELKKWLANQDGEKVRVDMKESKNGNYYLAVNTFVPDPNRAQSQPAGNRATPSNDFEDDSLPF